VPKSLRPSNGAASPVGKPSGVMPPGEPMEAISWLGCPTLPSHTVDHGSDRGFRLDLGACIVGAACPSPTSNDAFRMDATVPPGHWGIT
jgi:hypothetical protein